MNDRAVGFVSVRAALRPVKHTIVEPQAHALNVAVAALLCLFSALAVAVAVHPVPNALDRTGMRFMAAPDDTTKFRYAELVSRFGSVGAVIIAAVLLAGVCWVFTKDWRLAVFCVAAPGAAGLVELLMKEIVRRPAPGTAANSAHLSFPSGHATGATALACTLACIATLAVQHVGMRRLVVAAASLYALAIACARVVVEAHFFTDVVGGVLLGGAVATGLSVVFFTRRPSGRATSSQGYPSPPPGSLSG